MACSSHRKRFDQEIFSLGTEKLTSYGGVPGVATGAHITAWVNAAVPRLFIQLLIDKHLSIHYIYTI